MQFESCRDCQVNFNFMCTIQKLLSTIALLAFGLTVSYGQTFNDPTGTVMISLRNESNGTTSLYLKEGKKDFCYIYIDRGNNLRGKSYEDKNPVSFSIIGMVSGLGDINHIPTSGWASIVAVKPGYGYVARHKDGRTTVYTRIYVMQNIISASVNDNQGILGATIKYQTPFKP